MRYLPASWSIFRTSGSQQYDSHFALNFPLLNNVCLPWRQCLQNSQSPSARFRSAGTQLSTQGRLVLNSLSRSALPPLLTVGTSHLPNLHLCMPEPHFSRSCNAPCLFKQTAYILNPSSFYNSCTRLAVSSTQNEYRTGQNLRSESSHRPLPFLHTYLVKDLGEGTFHADR